MRNRMFRRWKSLTAEEVQALADASSPEIYTNLGFSHGPYMPPYSGDLDGKTLTFCFEDAPSCTYVFTGLHDLEWTQEGVTHHDYYMCLPSRPGIYLVQHHIVGSAPPQGRSVIIDLNTGLVTVCHARIGNKAAAREVSHRFFFGRIKGTEGGPLHAFTRELVGKAIVWTYSHDDFHVKHMYTSEYYYTYAMLKGGECWMASNPADFVKIADNLYVFSFLEERQGGAQGLFLMDLDAMHDVASFYSINGDQQFECYMAGAVGRFAPMETVFDDEEGRYF